MGYAVFMSVWGVVCLNESWRMALMVTAGMLAGFTCNVALDGNELWTDPEHTAGASYPITLKVQ